MRDSRGNDGCWQNDQDQPVAARDAVKCENEPPQLGVHRFVRCIGSASDEQRNQDAENTAYDVADYAG